MARRSLNIVEKTASAASMPTTGTDANGGRRARKLQQTTDHIGAAAWELFETHGFDAVTMEAIAEAADVAKGTLYKYFPVKEALIRHRFEKDRLTYGNEIAAAVLAKPLCSERLALFFQIEADYLNRMRPYLGAYIRHLLRSGQTEREQGDREAENFVALMLREGQARGEINPDLNADTMAKHLVFMRSGTLIRWLEGTDDALPAMLEDMLRLFLHGALRKTGS
jgi:AcrR family transcriptional regulator